MRRRKAAAWLMAIGLVVPSAWAELPHREYTTQTKTATTSPDGTTETDVALWTPASGKRFVLQGCTISANNAGTVELEVSDVDVVPPIHFQTAGARVLSHGGAPIYVSAKDAVLRYTTSVDGEFSLLCTGYEAE